MKMKGFEAVLESLFLKTYQKTLPRGDDHVRKEKKTGQENE